MSTIPGEIVSTAPAVSDPVREMWQTAAQGVRILHWFAFSKRRVGAVNPFAKPPAVLGRLKAVERILE